jgi:hypothetical protein
MHMRAADRREEKKSLCFMRLHSSVGIATSCRLDVWGSILGRLKGFFSTLQCPGGLSGQPSLLYEGYQWFYPRGHSGRSVKLTPHVHLVLKSRMVGLYLHSPKCLHGIVLR